MVDHAPTEPEKSRPRRRANPSNPLKFSTFPISSNLDHLMKFLKEIPCWPQMAMLVSPQVRITSDPDIEVIHIA